MTILTRNQTDWADKCSILWFWSFDLKEFEWDFDDDRNKTQLEASSSRRAGDHLKIESAQYRQRAGALMTETCCSELRYWNLSFDHSSETSKIKNRTQLEAASSKKADDS